ncbi:RsmB/NOP family class I SAM-dependent RNA methyltransferase [Sphingomonas prati]|uniref:16S rRNA (Cytosine967-C5)-methyltransferase n=1 Tax=Sphingomonas prati TaxID=1843237 RepID=A0A7W9BR34_9SPHN|nr:RsmB/NOP family class I SAM-dependent RNA methyltransferase [Sphingomonas prati]MBB5728578.1 16S rRNA (cytosine967-C5)-methyltransferase [Sphingomonas prati]GGE72676.1 rRNA cytosine-C5-methylase [Sphingomonas prati]
MTPAARVQAAIDLLNETIAAAGAGGAAADTLIARYFKTRRYAGSKDRRAVRDLVYAAIRRAGERPVSGRAAMLGLAVDQPEIRDLFDGSDHAPATIDPGELVARAGVAPAWLVAKLDTLDSAEQQALLGRAPLDLRVNRLKTDRETMLAELPGAEPTPHAPDGLRMPEGTQLEALTAYAEGRIEVQDEGSQLLALACEARAGMMVIDLCAGAGGKTLALAAAMKNDGRLIACDTDRRRLGNLAPRAVRAGVTIVEPKLLDPDREREALADFVKQADIVLVDAPCSGTGTWRRNPEARWRLTRARVEKLVMLQQHVLDIAASMVKPGGALVYAVCSLIDDEGAGGFDAFLTRHPKWTVDPVTIPAGVAHGKGRRLTPLHDGTDGFFVARARAPC